MKSINKNFINEIKHGGFRSFLKEALRLHIKAYYSKQEKSLIKLEYKGKSVFCKKGSLPVDGQLGRMYVNKNITKLILEDQHVRTPKGFTASSYTEAKKLFQLYRPSFPLIVKPLDGSLAKGVTWNIQTQAQLQPAIQNILKNTETLAVSKKFLVEEMFIGNEYRILMFQDRVLSCVHKIPATLVGDGKSTIQKLVNTFNKSRLPGFKMVLDSTAQKTLSINNLTPKSILQKNVKLKLRNNLNMSDGGRSIDVTPSMNRYFKKICETAIKSLGLHYGGIDLLAKDISKPNTPYVVLEINANPFYNMHEKPLVEGVGTNVSRKILKYIFPDIKLPNSTEKQPPPTK